MDPWGLVCMNDGRVEDSRGGLSAEISGDIDRITGVRRA